LLGNWRFHDNDFVLGLTVTLTPVYEVNVGTHYLANCARIPYMTL